MSLDGHLAEPNDGLDFLASVQRDDEDYGYMAFASFVQGYVVGRRTFDVVTELCGGQFPHVGKWPIYVVTFRFRPFGHGRRDIWLLGQPAFWLEANTPETQVTALFGATGEGTTFGVV